MRRSLLIGLCVGLMLSGAWGATPALLPNGQQQFVDANGAPLAGGSVYFYTPGTTTPKGTWQDIGEGTPNGNPVILDSAGRATIWGEGAYREILYDSIGNLIWDQITYGVPTSTATTGFGVEQTLVAGSTVDLGTITTNNVLISGGGTSIASFGTSALLGAPVFLLQFSGTNTLVYNATSMILPGRANLATAAGDSAIALYLGTGNWQIIQYTVSKSSPLAIGFGAQTTIASAATTDIATPGHNTQISGTTTISSFGATATTTQPLYMVEFSGALTLTYNATTMILPGGADITTRAGDSLTVLYLGSGKWQILSYATSALAPSGAQPSSSTFTTDGGISFTTSASSTTSTIYELICQGPGGGAGSSSGGSGSGAGGGGAGAYADVMVSGFAPNTVISGHVGGVGGAGSTSSGSPGANGSAPTKFTYAAVDFLSCGVGVGGSSGSGGGGLAGGAGGTLSTNYAGAGVTLVNTVVSMAGQAGAKGIYAGNNIGLGGAGGSVPLGQGGQTQISFASGHDNGITGAGFGAGGGAGASGDSSQNTGGDGAPGIAIIRGVQ